MNDDPESDDNDSDGDKCDQGDSGDDDNDDKSGKEQEDEDNEDEEDDILANEEEDQIPEINIPDMMLSTPIPEMPENTGVEIAWENAGVTGTNEREIPGVTVDDGNTWEQNTGVWDTHDMPTRTGNRFFHNTAREHRRMNEQIMDEWYGPRAHHFNLWD